MRVCNDDRERGLSLLLLLLHPHLLRFLAGVRTRYAPRDAGGWCGFVPRVCRIVEGRLMVDAAKPVPFSAPGRFCCVLCRCVSCMRLVWFNNGRLNPVGVCVSQADNSSSPFLFLLPPPLPPPTHTLFLSSLIYILFLLSPICF